MLAGCRIALPQYVRRCGSGLRLSGFARASRFGADSPRRVRLIGLDLRNELGIPQQRGLMCRHHDSGREGRSVIGFVTHESEVATRAATDTDSTCGAGPDSASQPRSRFAAMSDEQYWMQRLDEFLDYVKRTTNASDPANVIATLR